MRFPKYTYNWFKTTIGTICICNSKNDVKINDSFIYIDLESVIKGKLINPKIINKNDAPSRAQRVLRCKDILYQSVRPYQKNNYLFDIDRSDNQYVASTGYIQLRTNNNPMFIYQLLNTDNFNSKVMVRCTGTSYPAINSNDFSNISIHICNQEEQNKISDFLSSIDERIATQSKIIEDLNIQIKLLLDVFFNDINSYDVYKLNELGFIYNGLSGKSKEDFGQGLAFIPYTNIYNNNVVDTNLLQYVKIEENENQNKVLKGDILFTSSSETPYEVGVASIYLSDLDPIYLNSFSLGFRLNGNTINNKYLCYLFQSKYFRKIIFKYSQGSTRYNLNRKALLNHKIKFHKRDDQDKIVNLLDEINTKIKNESHILKQYEIQKSYLLNNLFI